MAAGRPRRRVSTFRSIGSRDGGRTLPGFAGAKLTSRDPDACLIQRIRQPQTHLSAVELMAAACGSRKTVGYGVGAVTKQPESVRDGTVEEICGPRVCIVVAPLRTAFSPA
jgi:hypothetical protein